MEMNKIETRLISYIQGGRVHPAALLTGPQSDSRWNLAKSVVKQLLCPNASATLRYCDKCNTCRRIAKEIHPDLFIYRELDEEQIKIDPLRELCHHMSLTPMEARAKVCIIDECHRMNNSSANAFLKTLEEPGEGRFFWLLTSQVNSLPETVVSRCVQFAIAPNNLETEPPQKNDEFEKYLREILSSKNTHSSIVALNSKEKTVAFVQFLAKELRDAALLPAGSPFFKGLPKEEAERRFEQTIELEGRLRSNANYGLMLENTLRNFI
jgi:DNA polymerase III gamma/tau subunit